MALKSLLFAEATANSKFDVSPGRKGSYSTAKRQSGKPILQAAAIKQVITLPETNLGPLLLHTSRKQLLS